MHAYKTIRNILSWLIGGILIALIGEFAIDLAREQGFYEHPTDHVVAIMGVLATIKNQFWFWPIVALLAGLVIGMWLDLFFRGRAGRGDTSRTPVSPLGGGPDYPYGLALQEVRLSLDLNNLDNTLETRLIIRNASNGPIEYSIEQLDTVVESIIVRAKPSGAILPRDALLTIFAGVGYTLKQYSSFQNRTSGTIEYSMTYGPPGAKPIRRAYKLLSIDIFKKEGEVSWNWIIQNESDEEIT